MGACYFEVHAKGTELDKLFQEAREQALHDYGHRGYTGTIAEKDSVVLRKKRPMPKKEAKAFAEKDSDENDKWGPAFAVPLCKSEEDEAIIGYLIYGYASE